MCSRVNRLTTGRYTITNTSQTLQVERTREQLPPVIVMKQRQTPLAEEERRRRHQHVVRHKIRSFARAANAAIFRILDSLPFTRPPDPTFRTRSGK